jgi:hypothetical protein
MNSCHVCVLQSQARRNGAPIFVRKKFVRKRLFENVCSKKFVRKRLFENVCSKKFVKKLIFEKRNENVFYVPAVTLLEEENWHLGLLKSQLGNKSS